MFLWKYISEEGHFLNTCSNVDPNFKNHPFQTLLSYKLKLLTIQRNVHISPSFNIFFYFFLIFLNSLLFSFSFLCWKNILNNQVEARGFSSTCLKLTMVKRCKGKTSFILDHSILPPFMHGKQKLKNKNKIKLCPYN